MKAALRSWRKAQNLVKWWPAILHHAELANDGAAFRAGSRGGSQHQKGLSLSKCKSPAFYAGLSIDKAVKPMLVMQV